MATPNVLRCSEALAAKQWKIAFAESASAGKMSYEFSTVPESGKILLGGLVCYDACVKEGLLEISPDLIRAFTAESAEVTRAMANSLCKIVEADVCVAVTGLTTPGGSETEEKPVGTMFVHVVLPNHQVERRFEFHGSPEEIVDKTIDETAKLILENVSI